MDVKERQVIYSQMTKNVSEIKKTAKQLKRCINSCIRDRKDKERDQLTKVYALLYSVWAEARLNQLIYMPYNSLGEDDVEYLYGQRSHLEKWKQLVSLALSKKENLSEEEQQEKENVIQTKITEYLSDAVTIRNRLAHGQWYYPFNSGKTACNQNIAEKYESLNVIEVNRWFSVFDLLADIARELLNARAENEYKALRKAYSEKFAEVDAINNTYASFTMEEKERQLRAKSKKR